MTLTDTTSPAGAEASSARPRVGVELDLARHAGRRRPGLVTRWVKRDPVRVVALALIAVQLLWRADVASHGFLANDDWALVIRAAELGPTRDFFLEMWNNHLQPGSNLVYWLTWRAFGVTYWPCVVVLIAMQAIVSVAFYRLLRTLLGPGWGLLIPLSLFIFSPLTLEATSWWVVGLNMLPMQLAMVLAIGAQVKYVRTGRLRHLVSLSLAVVLGLAFFEKSLLVVPLVFLVTAAFFVRGGPVRSIVRTVARYWPSWLVLAAISTLYLTFYSSRAESSLRTPESVLQVVTFLRQLVGQTLLPGLVGGPWDWHYVGDHPPMAATTDVNRWLAWIAIVTVVVVTIRLRPSAARAWTVLGLYLAMVVAMLAMTRLGVELSALAGLVPRYISDVVPVAAICIGVAILGLADTKEFDTRRSMPWPRALNEPGAIAVGVMAAFVAVVMVAIGTAWSGARFADGWATKYGRDYFYTTQSELATAPHGTVFLDLPVPERVVPAIMWPYNLQSQFFAPAERKPQFVAEAEDISVFDDSGRIRLGKIYGTATLPGPAPGCGYKIGGGQTLRLPLAESLYAWQRVVRVGYLSSGESNVTMRFGHASRDFVVHRGLHQTFFLVDGGGDAIELTVSDPAVTVCLDQVEVGSLGPK